MKQFYDNIIVDIYPYIEDFLSETSNLYFEIDSNSLDDLSTSDYVCVSFYTIFSFNSEVKVKVLTKIYVNKDDFLTYIKNKDTRIKFNQWHMNEKSNWYLIDISFDGVYNASINESQILYTDYTNHYLNEFLNYSNLAKQECINLVIKAKSKFTKNDLINDNDLILNELEDLLEISNLIDLIKYCYDNNESSELQNIIIDYVKNKNIFNLCTEELLDLTEYGVTVKYT